MHRKCQKKEPSVSPIVGFSPFFLYVLLYSRFILKNRALITVFKCWWKFSAPVMYERGLPLSWDMDLLLMEQLPKKPTTVASTFFMSTAFPLQALPVSNLGSLHFLSYSYSSVLTWKKISLNLQLKQIGFTAVYGTHAHRASSTVRNFSCLPKFRTSNSFNRERVIYENPSISRSQSALLNLYQVFSSSLGDAGWQKPWGYMGNPARMFTVPHRVITQPLCQQKRMWGDTLHFYQSLH